MNERKGGEKRDLHAILILTLISIKHDLTLFLSLEGFLSGAVLTLTLSLAIVLGGMNGYGTDGMSSLGASAIGGLIVAINVLLVTGMCFLSLKHVRQGLERMWLKHGVATFKRIKALLTSLRSRLASVWQKDPKQLQPEIQVN